MILIGATVKGLVTGLAMGIFSKKVSSLNSLVVLGTAVGLVLSLLVAFSPDGQGNYHFAEILVPGSILGAMVGFTCGKWGKIAANPALAVNNGSH